MLSAVINSLTSSSSYCYIGMDNLIKAADNFQGSSASVEEIKQNHFVEFINKIPIWDYYAVSREFYLALHDAEKREKIIKYYFDRKSTSDGKNLFFLV